MSSGMAEKLTKNKKILFVQSQNVSWIAGNFDCSFKFRFSVIKMILWTLNHNWMTEIRTSEGSNSKKLRRIYMKPLELN